MQESFAILYQFTIQRKKKEAKKSNLKGIFSHSPFKLSKVFHIIIIMQLKNISCIDSLYKIIISTSNDFQFSGTGMVHFCCLD